MLTMTCLLKEMGKNTLIKERVLTKESLHGTLKLAAARKKKIYRHIKRNSPL